jgi:hypothetical protein
VSLDLGIPLTLISEAVFARCLSAMKEGRVEASKALHPPASQFKRKKQEFLADLEKALYAPKLVSYAQVSFSFRKPRKNSTKLNYGAIATFGVAAAYPFRSWRKSRRHLTRIRACRLLLAPFSRRGLNDRKGPGGVSCRRLCSMESGCRPFRRH